jgi:hypothetical protein
LTLRSIPFTGGSACPVFATQRRCPRQTGMPPALPHGVVLSGLLMGARFDCLGLPFPPNSYTPVSRRTVPPGARILMQLPVFTQFHMAIGFTGVAFASLAILLRIPDFLCINVPPRLQPFVTNAHTLFGFGYLTCALFMPITANW